MENKYYIPSIEEFHVGFEYEQDYSIVQRDHEALENPWGYKIFEVKDYEFIDHLVETKFARVKYLDKEDIESLGFHRDYVRTKLVANIGFWIKRKYEDHFKSDKSDLYATYSTLTHILSLTRFTSSLDFEIKNKSELKKLLKQLNINDK